ncbi:MAG: glycosyltransferase family 87 protein [Verrucomicrobiota bacterium]
MTTNQQGAGLAILTVAFVVAAVAWTVSSAWSLSHTFDEPHHLATGLEWWQFGTYRWWTENPPLPKVVTAAVPYLTGMRLPARPAMLTPDPWLPGVELLEAAPDYARTLMLARIGTVSFLLLTLGLTFALAGGRKHLLSAFAATALVATYPTLLGHAGLATTDVAAVATVLLFLFCLDRWADRPSPARAAVVGAGFALAALCKLTAPALCLPLGLAWLAARRWRPYRWRMLLAQAALAGVVAFAVVWACYRFSVGRLDDLPPMEYIGTPVLPPPGQRSALVAWFCRLRLPAPEFWDGFLFLKAHDKHGHSAFLFGQIRDRGGFWNFYLVGLLLKSPLPFLLLLAACLPALLRKGRRPLEPRALGAGLAALVALALSTLLTVNIGLRHLLIVVPLLAIFIAGALTPWIEERVQRGGRARLVALVASGAALVASVAVVEIARPQLMAYFNPLAGREPGHALIDSDLDWGQDFLLLKRELRARQISTAHYGFFGTMNPCGPDMPELLPLVPKVPVAGWVVLSEQFYRSDFFVSIRRDSCASPHYDFKLEPGDSFDWLKTYEPVARIGATLRLYHVAER